MFYESRFDFARCGLPVEASLDSDWSEVESEFLEGRVFNAARRLRTLTGAQPDARTMNVEQILLTCDVLRAVGHEGDFHEIIDVAHKHHGDSPRITIQYVRALAMRGRYLKCERELNAFMEGQDNVDAGLLHLIRALNTGHLAQIERIPTAIQKIRAHDSQGGKELAIAQYEMAYAELHIRRWESALERLNFVIAELPGWSRPRLFKHQCLMSLGQVEAARTVLSQAIQDFPEEYGLLFANVGALIHSRQWAELVQLLDSALQRWTFDFGFGEEQDQDKRLETQSRSSRQTGAESEAEDDSKLKPGPELWMTAVKARALWHLKQFDAAIDAAELVSKKWADRWRELDRTGDAERIDIEPLVQDRNMCVAASVTMILRERNFAVDSRTIYKEMQGADGVASWQLDRWLRTQGILPVDINLEIESIRGMIDAGHALLATRSRILMAHQELIVGYDDSLEEIEVIDPSDGMPFHIPYSKIKQNYGESGENLVALIDTSSDHVGVEIPRQWISAEGLKRRLITRAIYAERIDEAIAHFKSLDPDSIECARIAYRFPELFVVDGELKPIIERLAFDEAVDLSTRYQAGMQFLQAGESELAELTAEQRAQLDKLRSELPYYMQRLQSIHRARSSGQWQRMKRICIVMLERAAGLAEFWNLYATALEGCGDYIGAEEAREICLEMEPSNVIANLNKINDSEAPLELRLQTGKELLARRPRLEPAHLLCAELVGLSGDSIAQEARLKLACKLFPYSGNSQMALRDYYLSQGRSDLAENVGASDDKEALTELSSDSKPNAASTNEVKDDEVTGAETDKGVHFSAERLATLETQNLLESLGMVSHLLHAMTAQSESQQKNNSPELEESRKTLEKTRNNYENLIAELTRRSTAGTLTPVENLQLDRMLLLAELRNDDNDPVQALKKWLPESLPTPVSKFVGLFLAGMPFPNRQLGPTLDLMLAWMSKMLEDQQVDVGAQLIRVAIQMKRGTLVAARQTLQQIIETKPVPTAYLKLAQLDMDNGDFGKAFESLKECLNLEPGNMEALQMLANIFLQVEDQKGLRGCVERLVALAPYDQDHADTYLGFLLSVAGPQVAKDWFAYASTRYTKHFQYYWRAKLNIAFRNWPAADDTIKKLAELDPAQALLLQINKFHAHGRPPRCRALIMEGLKKYPDDGRFASLIPKFFPDDTALLRKSLLVTFSVDTFALWFKRSSNSDLLKLVSEADDKTANSLLLVAYRHFSAQNSLKRFAKFFEALESRDGLNNLPTFILLDIRHGSDKACEERARRLLGDDSGNPDYLHVIANYYRTSRPSVSAKLYRQHYTLTGSMQSLYHSGRCLLAAGEPESAGEAFSLCLNEPGIQPFVLAELFKLGQLTKSNAALINKILSNDDVNEYVADFATTAVKVAAQLRIGLPGKWLDWAVARARHLQKESHERELKEHELEEQLQLEVMIWIWCREHSEMSVFESLAGHFKHYKYYFTLPISYDWTHNTEWASSHRLAVR